MTIEKALKQNLEEGKAERMVVDNVTFSRLPLTEPVLWITYKDIMQRTRSLEEVTDVARKAKEMVDSTGLSWEDYMRLPCFGPDYKSETSIWANFSCSMSLFYDAFHCVSEEIRGLWYYDYDHDYVVIIPRDASHLLVAKHYPTEEEYNLLKKLGFKYKGYRVNHLEPSYVFFLNQGKYNAATLDGIIVL